MSLSYRWKALEEPGASFSKELGTRFPVEAREWFPDRGSTLENHLSLKRLGSSRRVKYRNSSKVVTNLNCKQSLGRL